MDCGRYVNPETIRAPQLRFRVKSPLPTAASSNRTSTITICCASTRRRRVKCISCKALMALAASASRALLRLPQPCATLFLRRRASPSAACRFARKISPSCVAFLAWARKFPRADGRQTVSRFFHPQFLLDHEIRFLAAQGSLQANHYGAEHRTPLGVFLEFLVRHFSVAVWAGHHVDQSSDQPANHHENDNVVQHDARSPIPSCRKPPSRARGICFCPDDRVFWCTATSGAP